MSRYSSISSYSQIYKKSWGRSLKIIFNARPHEKFYIAITGCLLWLIPPYPSGNIRRIAEGRIFTHIVNSLGNIGEIQVAGRWITHRIPSRHGPIVTHVFQWHDLTGCVGKTSPLDPGPGLIG